MGENTFLRKGDMKLNMRKCSSLIIILIFIVAGILFVSSGFETRTDVYLQDFSVSEDGSVITIRTLLSGSMGYIRAIKTEKVNDAIYCSFYCAFGGFNSSIGSKNRFEIKLDASCTKIYFDRGTEADDLVLEKDTAANIWVEKRLGTL